MSFRYRPEVIGSAESRLEFGLIAEEVAEVFQELVVYDEGQDRMGVGYHQLVPLLLDELQEQHREMQALKWLVGVMLLTGVAVTVRRWRFG